MNSLIQVPPKYQRYTQRGIALFLVLIFLVILTLLGVFAIQGVTLNERVARNQLDRNIAFQAAEAALRDAERDLSRRLANGADCSANDPCRTIPSGDNSLEDAPEAFTAPACEKGLCASAADTAAQQVWEIERNWENATQYGTYTGAAKIPSVNRQPKYLIEYADFDLDGGVFFQITARGYGVNDQTVVTLQSTYKRKI